MPVRVGSSEGLGLIVDADAEPTDAHGDARYTYGAQMLGGQDCVATVLGHGSLSSREEHDSVLWKEAWSEEPTQELSGIARPGPWAVVSEATRGVRKPRARSAEIANSN
jgi:hypothetical protein